MTSRQMRFLFILGGAAIASGCASLGVKPWQRDVLARQEMQLNGDPLDAAIDDHLYFSKEASSGGRTFAGGGCGCN
ncbi:MAG TPA: DUF4266 domain-containing protein [Steroidobacteraceae bacterium]|nr:DUF4266 domain-containing protein [Steroidobacteraceae bacterium]